MKNNEKKDNLMMVAAYWKQRYMAAISDTIEPEKIEELNIGIVDIQVLLKTAREKLLIFQYHGKEHTQSFMSMAQEIETMLFKLKEAENLVNKKSFEILLEDYPV